MNKIPNLSPDGWITNNSLKMTKLFELFLATEKSQSNRFIDDVYSMKHILYHYRESNELIAKVNEALSKIYRNYFKTVDVIIEKSENKDFPHERLIVEISTLGYDGETYSLKESIDYVENNIVNFDALLEEMNKE